MVFFLNTKDGWTDCKAQPSSVAFSFDLRSVTVFLEHKRVLECTAFLNAKESWIYGTIQMDADHTAFVPINLVIVSYLNTKMNREQVASLQLH